MDETSRRMPLPWSGVLIAALILMNLALVGQNRRLLGSRSADVDDIKPGAILPTSLTGINVINGEYVAFDLDTGQTQTLLIYVSAHCPVCQDSIELLHEIGIIGRSKWNVVWLSSDPVPDARAFVGNLRIENDHVLAEIPWRLFERLRLHRVPRAVLVNRDGTVERVWTGRLELQDMRDLFAPSLTFRSLEGLTK